ncbi:MAG: hypothetical protein FJ291_22445 [Planctomycetes bacterium]|nr:hypothetical protein [Planctomycetota bacterium]
MTTDIGEDPAPPGATGHLRRALGHALEASRCAVALILGQVERGASAIVRQAIVGFLLVGIALLGIVLFACGLAAFLESRLGVPGSGPMAIGGTLLAIVSFIVFLRSKWTRR